MHPKVKTHLSATEREPMGDYVDSKDLENFLWRQGVFGHLHGVDQVQRLGRCLRSFLFARGFRHLPSSTTGRKVGDRAMPEHCQYKANRSYPREQLGRVESADALYHLFSVEVE